MNTKVILTVLLAVNLYVAVSVMAYVPPPPPPLPPTGPPPCTAKCCSSGNPCDCPLGPGGTGGTGGTGGHGTGGSIGVLAWGGGSGGSCSTCGGNNGMPTTADPVYIKNSEFILSETDVSIRGRTLSVDITRTYGSRRTTTSPFGYGWAVNHDMRIARDSIGYPNWRLLYLTAADGTSLQYDKDASDSTKFVRASVPDQYVKYDTANHRFTLVRINDANYIFNSQDMLWKTQDRFGNTIVFDHNATYPQCIDKITDDLGREIKLTYDSSHRIVEINDFANREWAYNYDASTGDLLTVTGPNTPDHPNGLTTTYTYTNHNLETIIDPNNNEIVRNHYNVDDKIYQQDIDGASYDITNDTANGVMTTIDREGYKTEQAYNTTGQLIGQTVYTKDLSDYFTTTYSYDSKGSRTLVTYPASNVTAFTYDSSDRLIGTYVKTDSSQPNDRSDADVLATTYTYDTAWPRKIKTETDPMGNVTTNDYNSVTGNLEKITYPGVTIDGSTKYPTTKFTYDSYSRLVTTTAADGIVTKYEYYTNVNDPNYGRLWKVVQDYNDTGNCLNIITEYKYDILGRMCEITDPNGDVTKLTFNNLNQLEKSTTPSPYNYATLFHYDKNGNHSKVEREIGGDNEPNQITQFVYDRYKKLQRVTNPLDYVTKYRYNKNKDVNDVNDAENHMTKYEHNVWGLVSKVTDANGGETLYGYTDNGKLHTITDANNNVTTYSYDGFDRPTTITYPDTTTEDFTYDKNGNILTKTTRKGDTIEYTYNALGWLMTKTRPDEDAVEYAYDIAGRVKEVTQGAATLAAYDYDRVGRQESVEDADSRLVEYQYDDRGLRTRLDYPDDSYVTYEYDSMGRLRKINYNGSMVAEYGYDELGRKVLLELGNDANAVYIYDLGNRLTELKNKFNSATTQTIGYTSYDDVGNRLNMVIDGDTHSYTYDNRYQLTAVDYPAGFGTDTTYWYDRLGSRTSTVAGSTAAYLHNKLNQYYSVASVAYSYDDNGNLTNDGTYKYYYDCENRLTDVNEVDNDRVAHYEYDYQGRRISKTDYTLSPAVCTLFVYDGDNLIAEYSSGGTLLRKYVYGPKIDEPICMISISGGNETKYYYHFDGLGSVVALTASNGTIAEQYHYDVFGNPSGTSSLGNRFMFTGREYDSETSNYYYRARYYKPSIGRFLQTDPMSYIVGLNLYTYVLNNPVNLIDPTGLSPYKDCFTDCLNAMTGGYVGRICGSGLSLTALFAKAAGATTIPELLAIVPTWMTGAAVGCAIGCGIDALPIDDGPIRRHPPCCHFGVNGQRF